MKKLMVAFIVPLTTCLVVYCPLAAKAQGVRLSVSGTLSIVSAGVGGDHCAEGTPPSVIAIAFGAHFLGAGKSLLVERFESSLNDLPFTTGTFSQATSIRRRVSAPSSPFDNLAEGNAASHYLVERVQQLIAAVKEGKTPAIGDAQGGGLLDAPKAETNNGKRDLAITRIAGVKGLRL